VIEYSEQEFEFLSLKNKERIVLQEGTYLMKREAFGMTIRLYALGKQYMEAYYSFKTHKLETIKLVKEDRLTIYLNKIKIT
jgi:hypothetical protein